MTFSLANPSRRFHAAQPISVLRDRLRARVTQVAIDRLDDQTLCDIGLPTRRERPLPRHEAAARLALMSCR